MKVYEEERVKELKDIELLMDDARGRRVLNRLLEHCHVFHSTMAVGDPHATAFNEGKRNAALPFLADIMEAAPKKFMVMMLEGKERRDRIKFRLEKETEEERED